MGNLVLEKLNDSDVFNYNFKSFIDLIKFLDNTPYNYDIFETLVSQDESDLEWFGNKTFKKAKDIVLNGSNIYDIKDIINVNSQLEDNLPYLSKRRNIRNSTYGFRPNVSKFLNGNPKSMYKLVRDTRYNRVNVIFSGSFSNQIDQKQILNRGICTLNLLKLLSNFGYDVDFRFMGVLCDNTYGVISAKEYIKFEILVNSFDLATLYYPLCDNSFFRRIIFNLIEKTPVKSLHWIHYGETVNNFEKICEIDDAIIIKSPDVIGIKGNDIIEDFVNFYNVLDIEKYLDSNKLEYDNKLKKFLLRK